MERLGQTAAQLRELLMQQAWLADWRPLIARTPDGILLIVPALMTLLLILLLMRPRGKGHSKRRGRPARARAASPAVGRQSNLQTEPSATATAPAAASTRTPATASPASTRTAAKADAAPARAGADDDNRSVRVFVSSTFLDMQAERDDLVTKTFPALRAKYRARGVELFEVDLRWGITREQQERGETLPTLLAEVDRCRPYFIGLLGDRYGWVPPVSALTDKLKADYPILAEAEGASVTAMEITHGVLANPDTAARSCFFERDPTWDWRAMLDDADRATASEEPEAARARLADLKAMIRQKARVEPYARPAEIGEKVTAALDALLAARFPETDAPDAFEQTGRLHRAYARERRSLHVGADGYIAELNRWMAADAAPRLITGASGGGKSTLVANWIHAWRLAHPKDIVFEHYLGASPDSAEPMLVMRRLWEHLNRAEGESAEPPSDNAELMDMSAALAQRLTQVRSDAERGDVHILIALDGLDKLASEQNLRWLPITPGVHWLASSLPGEANTAAFARGFLSLDVKPLGEGERRDFVAGTLARWRRELEPQHIARILQPAAAELAGSPLYLKTVLEELRVSADNARLAERLEDYRAARHMPDLFDRVLARLERDCEPGLVSKVLPLVWASRAGLEEAEITAIAAVAPLAWATLRNGLGDSLRDSAGRIAFGHDYLTQAVAKRYLNGAEARRAAHLAIAARFEARGADQRQAEELPYQLRAAGEEGEDQAWTRLEALLVDFDRFRLLRDRGDGELLSYWLSLKARGRDPEQLLCAAFHDRVGDPQHWSRADLDLSFALFSFLHFSGATNDRSGLVERRTEACKVLLGPDHPDTLTSMSDFATVLFARGDLEGAQRLNESVLESRIRILGEEHPLTLRSMSNLGFTLFGRGDLDGAEKVERRSIDAQMRSLGPEHPQTLLSLSNLAGSLRARGDFKGALSLQERVMEAQTRVLGAEHPDTVMSLSGIANTLRGMGDLGRAETIERRAMEISTRLFGMEHPTTLMMMNNLAQTLKAGHDFKAAEEIEERVLEASKRLFGAEQLNTLTATSNLAQTRLSVGDVNGAILLLFPALNIMERVLGPNHPVTLSSKTDFALVLAAKGDTKEAISLQESVLASRIRVFGEAHADTTVAAEVLEMLRAKAR